MADRTSGVTLAQAPLVVRSTRSMGSTITFQVVQGDLAEALIDRAIDAAVDEFRGLEASCTRFSSASSLMRANASPNDWCAVDRTCYDAIDAAHLAYVTTAGRFDPRVHDDLVRLGYDRSMAAGGISPRGRDSLAGRVAYAPWSPAFDDLRTRVRVGEHSLDLGGIGRGLAVRHAAGQLDRIGARYLIDAGGDCMCRGLGPDGEPWRLGVRDPSGATTPIAVLEAADAAVATSSSQLARWVIADQTVHHLIDPRTGQPGGEGLASVTVIAPDPADAEVWSKTLFLEGLAGIEAAATDRDLAAVWVEESGNLGRSALMEPHLIWMRP